jgi:uncharacterized repeat protein (TIGR02543 family)
MRRKILVLFLAIIVTLSLSFGILFSSAETTGLVDGSGNAYLVDYDTNGWDNHSYNTPYYDSQGNTVITSSNGAYWKGTAEDGGTKFVLTCAYIVNYTELDVTKDIEVKFAVNPNCAWNVNSGWFLLNLFDSVDTIHSASMNAWNSALGAKAIVWASADSTGDYSGFYNKFNYNNNVSTEANYINDASSNGNVATLTFHIAENADNSYIALNGTSFTALALKQSDFANGIAYLQMASSATNEIFSGVKNIEDLSTDGKLYDSEGNIYAEEYDTNGWDTHPAGKAWTDSNGKTVISTASGSYDPNNTMATSDTGTIFVLGGGMYLTNYTALDVTKQINISFAMNPNNAWGKGNGWFLLNLFDSISDIHTAGTSGWNQSAYDTKLVMWGSGDSTGDYSAFYNALKIENQISNNLNYFNGRTVTVSIVIGVTSGSSYVAINNYKIASITAVQSDFEGGYAYLQAASSVTNEFKAKVSTSDIEQTYDTKVTFTSELGGFEDAYAYTNIGGTVTPTEEIARAGYNVSWFTENDELFDFSTTISENITLYAKWIKTPANPVDFKGNPYVYSYDSNGWDKHESGSFYANEDGEYLIGTACGSYNTANCYTTGSDGTTFVLAAATYIINFNELDLTKAINITMTLNSQKAWNEKSDFVINLFNTVEQAWAADTNGWNPSYGAKVITWGSTKDSSAYFNKFTVNEISSETANYVNFKDDSNSNSSILTIYIGETAEESFVAMNGIKFASLSVCRNDFFDSKAFLSFLAIGTNEFKAKIEQSDIDADITYKSNVSAYENSKYTAKIGDVISKPTDPQLEGYTFCGWYTDLSCTVAYTFGKNVTGDVTIYAKFKSDTATYYNVTFSSRTGLFDSQTMEVESGQLISEFPSYFSYMGYYVNWKDENYYEFDLNSPITSDIILYADWTEAEFILYHKMYDVVDETYLYGFEADDNGWDTEYTTYNIGDTFVDAEGNTIISQYYGGYQHDSSFSTMDDKTGFLLPCAGAITNLNKLDVKKKITIKMSTNNWDTLNENNPAAGYMTFQLFESLYAALKSGQSNNANAKLALQTSTVSANTVYNKFYDVLNDKISETFGYERDTQYTIEIYISEDGVTSYASINGVKFTDLGGLKQSDFVDGYCYFHLANNGSTNMCYSLVSQEFNLEVEGSENGKVTLSKTEAINFKDQLTMIVDADEGYIVKSIFIGEKEYTLDEGGIITFYKAWGDETISVEFAAVCACSFVSNGGSDVEIIKTYIGGTYYKPANPKKEGYKFIGWYTDAELTTLYDFKTAATQNIILYAKWEVKTDTTEDTTTTKKGCKSSTFPVISIISILAFAFFLKYKK